MNCRIIKRCEKFEVQYETDKHFMGKHTRSMKVWCTLKNCAGETALFDTEDEAERAMRDYAERHLVNNVVRRFVI